jgi:hypothetical protein
LRFRLDSVSAAQRRKFDKFFNRLNRQQILEILLNSKPPANFEKWVAVYHHCKGSGRKSHLPCKRKKGRKKKRIQNIALPCHRHTSQTLDIRLAKPLPSFVTFEEAEKASKKKKREKKNVL